MDFLKNYWKYWVLCGMLSKLAFNFVDKYSVDVDRVLYVISSSGLTLKFIE